MNPLWYLLIPITFLLSILLFGCRLTVDEDGFPISFEWGYLYYKKRQDELNKEKDSN